MATSESTVIVKAIDQLMLTDITDSYSVELSKDTYVFTGDSPAGASSGSCSIDIRVYRGSEELKNVDEQNPSTQILTVQQLPAISSSEPISATIDSNSGKWIDDTSTTPATRKWVPFKLNVSIKANETLSTVKEIPLKITITQTEGQSSIELSKTFTVTVSKAGSTVVNTTYYYGYSNNGTNPSSVPAASSTTPGHWQTSPWSTVPAGSYYWTQTNNIFSDNHTATTYSVTYIPYGGYGVSLKNDTHTFTAGVSSSTTVTAEVYKGSTALSYEFGLPTIPSALSGKLSAAYGTTSGGQQDKTKLVITAATNLDGAGITNGELTIPITTELEATSHLTFNRQFAWSLTSSSYTWIKYAPTDDTTVVPTDITDTPQDDTKYVGMAVTKTSPAPTTKSSYAWSKYMGDDGFSIWTSSANLIDVAGHVGEQYYVKVTDLNEYSANGPKPKVNDILIWNSIYQYKIRAIETFNTWQVVKIYSEDRVSIKGDPGVSPTIYWLDVSNATIVRQNNASPYSYSPSSITFVAKTQTGTTTSDYTAGSYRVLVNGAQKSWVDITDSNSGTYNLPTDTNINSVKIELYKEKKNATTHSLLDAENLAIAVDGQDGQNGQDGQDGYLVWNVVTGHSPHSGTYSGSSKKYFNFGGSNNDLVAQGSAIPRVNEHIVQADRYQYTIDAVTDESNYKKVWINTGIDLKATNKASITFYTRSANQPSGKPFSDNTVYTFADHTFSTSPVQGWSVGIPAIENTKSLWSSYVEVSSKEDTITIAPTDWSTPAKVMEDAKWISISAVGGQEFISRDGGNTYSPDSIKLTPEFQNTTWWTDSTTNKVGWAYSTDGGVQYTDIVSSIAPWNDRYNSVTHTLTIQKGDVSDAASGSAIFKNNPIIIFRCKAVETDASGNNLVDYYTIVKNKDDKAIVDEDIQYAKSSSGASPPDADPSPWVNDITTLGTVQPGWFLWTRMRFKYADNTYSDYTYTKSLQGVTGVGITSVTRLNFLVGPIYKGYLYQGTFYEDVDHTKPITPIADAYYFDQTAGQNVYYRYEDSTFESKGASLQPSAPSGEITTSADIANGWTKGSPHYIDGGQYYTCEQVAYDNNTFSWSVVVLDNMVTNAYIEIDRQQGEIDIVSEKIVNLEQTDEITSSVLTLTQPAYVGSLHELHIAPTMATGRGSISSLYPKTTLYPSSTLYPREPILIVESSNAAYGTKYQYHLDIDALSWTSSTCYDEFVYQDGRCWIVRRTMSGNNVVETIEARQNITPVNKVITVSGEEITIPDDVIIIPTSTGITLKLYGANEETISNCNFKYKAIYLTDNPYTSNFTSNLDLISRINIAPGNIKIQAKNIQLEGYTTINEGFKIDLQGNMECQNANINGSLITRDGILTNLTYPCEVWGELPESLPQTFSTNGGGLVGFIPSNYGSYASYVYYSFLNFNVEIPEHFIVTSAKIRVNSVPISWKSSVDGAQLALGVCQKMRVFVGEHLREIEKTDSLWIWGIYLGDHNQQSFTPVPSVAEHDFSPAGFDTYLTEDFSDVFTHAGHYDIVYKTNMAKPISRVTSSDGGVSQLGPYTGWLDGTLEILGYLQNNPTEGGE